VERAPQLTPPSTIRVRPVTQPASGEARNSATPEMSSGWPKRPSGVIANMLAPRSARVCVVISVSITPGAIVLTVMPRGPNSFASACDNVAMAALEAE
jgi:hypothetical protein